MSWQPIETAPKDDDWVLIYSETRGVQKAQWNNDFALPKGQWEIFMTAEYDNEYNIIEDVTHWMPLPEPPQ